jgi:hypothetical protein
MKCRYSETDIALYVEGDVGPAKACEIQTHLSVCTQCRDLVIELRESQAVLKTLKQDTVSATALALVRSQVLAEIQAGVKPVWGRWVYALAGGVFVAVVAVGSMLEMRKPQVEEIVKSDPLPPPAAVPLTSTCSWRGQRSNSEELGWTRPRLCPGLRIEHGNGKCRSYPQWCLLRRARSRV